jgi:catechol 2,3-dioxygenase-like lactoylglutathione lyase family enzyme
MLASQKIMAFVGTQAPAKARTFYRDILGLPLLSEDGFALAFDAHGVMLRVSIVQNVEPAPYTVLGWQVDDLGTVARALQTAGVRFERYPGMDQDEAGVWKSPSGAKVAWFKDPDGNTLSLAEL